MIECSNSIDSVALIKIASYLAVTDSITILPFMFASDNSLRVVCPCCILDKRVDAPEFEQLKQSDSWAALFTKYRAKLHDFEIREPAESLIVEEGFTTRSITDVTRRAKYARIDTPIFRDLGFRGYRFDKNVFVPIAVHRNRHMLRIGLPAPEILKDTPFLQRAAASWIFRLNEVPPIEIPDILPLSNIGGIQISNPIVGRNVYSWNQEVQLGKFYNTMVIRANKKLFLKEKLEAQQAGIESGPQEGHNAGGRADFARQS